TAPTRRRSGSSPCGPEQSSRRDWRKAVRRTGATSVPRAAQAMSRQALLVPLPLDEPAEGDQADQGDDEPEPEAPDDRDDDPDDDEDPADADPSDASASPAVDCHACLLASRDARRVTRLTYSCIGIYDRRRAPSSDDGRCLQRGRRAPAAADPGRPRRRGAARERPRARARAGSG